MLHDEISRGVSHQPVTSLKEIQFEPLLNTEQAVRFTVFKSADCGGFGLQR